ncbi:hypothetical protein SNE25_08650 [Mucilaginibacter sabulilitoris]|uniref:Uncharacterized protein n=1 Tax=Mucilaginibacter sabulilitoris TaxID=1173583 RepID=A0ABZ0TR34_9SPHI|nr:hypothetical protein [Mucilaginibacter sabulilitoris]WPU95591.1 hypothetical protein SNE25_08650 [Mucilaginibacter sabulilitoris]
MPVRSPAQSLVGGREKYILLKALYWTNTPFSSCKYFLHENEPLIRELFFSNPESAYSLIMKRSISYIALKIYGGKNYDQFLDCMTCDDEEPNSIWSPLSDYGSTHNDKSIWNENGIYGSKTSDYSPFNMNAKYPPRIKDGSEKFIGYLTINKNNPDRLQLPAANMICEHRDRILKEGVEHHAQMFSRVY